MKFYFHSRANAELNEAVRYYEDCQLGLGLDFSEEVYSTIQRACNYPEAWCGSSLLRTCIGDQVTGKIECKQNHRHEATGYRRLSRDAK